MTLKEVLNLWDDWNIPLVLNNKNLDRITKFNQISDFGFSDTRPEEYNCLLFRKVMAFGKYDETLYIRLSDHDSFTYDRLCEIASKAIDGLREYDEEQAQEYLWNEVEIQDPFEREFFGLGECEESDNSMENQCATCPYHYMDDGDDFPWCHFDSSVHPTPAPCEYDDVYYMDE